MQFVGRAVLAGVDQDIEPLAGEAGELRSAPGDSVEASSANTTAPPVGESMSSGHTKR